jgi:hypothetical protein
MANRTEGTTRPRPGSRSVAQDARAALEADATEAVDVSNGNGAAEGVSESGNFSFEKGVKMPAVGRKGSHTEIPWSKMEIGDSFAIPAPSDDKEINNLRAALARAAKREGVTVSTRHMNNEGKVRCWRVADDANRGRGRPKGGGKKKEAAATATA